MRLNYSTHILTVSNYKCLVVIKHLKWKTKEDEKTITARFSQGGVTFNDK